MKENNIEKRGGYVNLDITELEPSPAEGVIGMHRVTDSVGMDKVIRISRQTLDKKLED